MGNNRIIKAVLPRMISLLLILCTLTSNLAGGIVFAITGEEYTHDASCGYAEDGICTCADAESQGSLSDSEELTLISPGSDSSVSFMSTASGDSEAGVTATLYSTGSDTGTPVVFTADGWTTVDGEPVELSQSLSRGKNLMKIKWVFNCSTAHTLSISVPAGIYIDNGTWSSVGQQGSLLTNVSFTTLDIDSGTKNPQQGVGTYYNSQTGTLTYTTAPIENADYLVTETIVLYIGFDEALWSKTKNTAERKAEELSVGDDPAVSVLVDGSLSACLRKIYAGVNGKGIHTWQRSFPDQGITSITTMAEAQSPIGFTLYDSEQNTSADWAFQEVRSKIKIYVTDANGTDRGITIPATNAYIRDADMKKMAYSGASFDAETQTFTVTDPRRNDIKAFYYLFPVFELTEDSGLQEGDILRIKVTNTFVTYTGAVRTSESEEELTFYPFKPVLKFNAYDNYQNVYTPLQFERNYVEVLGCLSLSNDGFDAAKNVSITVTFDTDYNSDSGDLPDILVSGYRVPLPRGETATITAYTISKDGQTKGTKVFENKKNTGSAQYSSVFVAADADTYIYKIEYTISTLTAQTVMCDTGGWRNLDCTGHIYGLVAATTEASMTYSYVDSNKVENTDTVEISIKAVEGGRELGSRLVLVPEKENVSVTAGTDATMTMIITAADVQNASATYLVDPIIFFVAPAGVEVTGVTSGYSSATMTDVGDVVDKGLANDGSTIYELVLNAPDGACGFKLGSTGVEITNELYVQVSFTPDPSLQDSSYPLAGRLLVTNKYGGKYIQSDLAGTSGHYTATDDFNVDNDSNTKKFGSLQSGLNLAMIIKPLTSSMSYTTYVSEAGANNWRNGTSDQAELEIQPGRKYDYKIVMENNSGSIIPKVNTALYIPLPHGGEGALPDVMGGNTALHAQARLLSAITGYNEEHWDVRYSIDATAGNYNNGQSSFEAVVDGTAYATWLTAAEIESDDSLHYEDVTYVKLVPLVDFAKDYTDQLIMTLRVTSGVEGNSIIYSSAAWSQYDNYGSRVEKGVLSNTAFIKVKIIPRTDDFTDKSEASDQQIINSISLHTNTDASQYGFENFADVRFYITDITAHSFNLATQQSVEAATETEVTRKDSTFGISIQLNAANAEGQGVTNVLDLATVYSALDTADTNEYGVKGVAFGTGYDYADNTVSLTLSHYDTIIDINTERYVDITLQNEYGSVTIIYRVYIHRELTQIEVSTAILSGKYFNNLGGTSSKETTVTGNSAVTAGFVINDYISNYFTETGLYVALDGGFPGNTGLTLIDITEQAAPKYYCYSVSEAGVATVPLTLFTNMDGSGNFAALKGDNISRTFLLIADFSKVSNPLTGNFTLALTADRTQAAINQNLPEFKMPLTIHFTAERTFDIDGTAGTLTDGVMQLELTLTGTAGNGYDFLYNSRDDKVKLSFDSLPAGSYLLYNQKEYYPVVEDDGMSILVDIPEITGEQTYSMTLHTPYQAVNGSSIAFTAHYMVSASYRENQSMGGISMDSAVFDSAVTTTAPAALKIQREGNAGYHLATAEQLTDGVKFLVTRQGAAVGNALTWNVYQKTSGGYSETAKASGTVAANADSFTVAFDGATVGKSYRVVLSYGTETAVFNILVIDSVG